MGWDADAVYGGRPFDYVDPEQDPSAARAFYAASDEAVALAGGVDSFLVHGGLDVSSCVEVLARLSGETNRQAVWDVERTRELNNSIQWPDLTTLPETEHWHVASARAFLRVCAEQGYGIQFDP